MIPNYSRVKFLLLICILLAGAFRFFDLVTIFTYNEIQSVVFEKLPYIASSMALSALFVLLRAKAWQVCGKIHAFAVSFKASLITTYICCVIDIITFPSRIIADGFRFTTLEGDDAKRKLGMCILYRLTIAVPYIFALVMVSASSRVVLLGCILASCLAVLFKPARSKVHHVISIVKSYRNTGKALIHLLLLNFLPGLFDALRISILIYALQPTLSMPFVMLASQVLSAHLVSAFSGVPAGIGTREALYYFILHDSFSPGEIVDLSLLSRFTGEFFSAFIGWIVLIYTQINFKDVIGLSEHKNP